MKTTSKLQPANILVGLGGLKEHGKDEVADHLAAKHGYHAMGMSQPLNEVLLMLNPLIPSVSFPDRDVMRYKDHYEAVGYTAAKEHPEVRRLLQVLGTDIGRDMINPDLWADMAGNEAQERLDTQSVAITGIRFKNELAMVQQLFGITIWIDRPGHTTKADAHPSENSVQQSDFDITILNDGTLDDLYRKVDEFVALPVIRDYSPAWARARNWPTYDH